MSERNNGASPRDESPVPSSGLGEAIQRHAAALVKASTNSAGMMAINPMQLFTELELAQVRIEVLFEALVDVGVLDPARLTIRLRDKLLAEVAQIEESNAAPQIAIARGSVPRNG